MENTYFLERFNSAISFLPDFLRETLFLVDNEIKEKTTEIHLRVEKDVTLNCDFKEIPLYELTRKEIITSRQLLENCFTRLCNFSVYSHQDEINNGFVTVFGGHRVGLAGTVVYSEEKEIKNIKNISSLNIRISKEIKGISADYNKFLNDGLLILGPPASGKTTLLRDIIRNISQKSRVSVIDSRGEISAIKNGVPQNDIGKFTDVINMAKKQDGIEIAIRSLNPKFIAFDEISTETEVEKVELGLYSGVKFLLTMHLGSIEEIKKKKISQNLLKSGAIKHIILLDYNRKGQVFSVNTDEENNVLLKKEELY